MFAETHGQETTQSLRPGGPEHLKTGIRTASPEEQGSSHTWGSTVGVASPELKSEIQGEPCSVWWQDSKSVFHSVSNI